MIRNASDPRRAHVSWAAAAGAQFYVVRYGIATAALTYTYHVHSGTAAQINALAREQRYTFAVDAVNEAGITPGAVHELQHA